MKGKLRFWMRYTLRELQHRRQIEARQQHRINKISSRTRNINQKDRKNLSEYKWTCQHRVTADTKYEGLHRWPQRDKIGRQLRIYITYITTQTWPPKPKRRREITLTPEDCTQETIHHTQGSSSASRSNELSSAASKRMKVPSA